MKWGEKSENWEKRKPPKFSRKQARMRNRGFLWKCSPFQVDIHDSRLTPLIFESRYDPHSIRIPIPTYLQLYKHGQHRWSWGMDRESSWLQCICRSFHESTVFFIKYYRFFALERGWRSQDKVHRAVHKRRWASLLQWCYEKTCVCRWPNKRSAGYSGHSVVWSSLSRSHQLLQR